MYYTSRLMGAVKSGEYGRYIRNYLGSSTVNMYKHWVEIKAFSDTINVALNKTVTINVPYINSLGNAVDGNTYYTNYLSTKFSIDEIPYIQIDLGTSYLLQHITMWHYYNDGRKYSNNKLQISENGTNWTTLFDSEVDGIYSETAEGKTIYL